MTLDERVTQVEHELDGVKRHLERCESEHVSLLKSYAALAAGRERERRETDESMRLLADYLDDRITGLAKRSTGGGDESDADLADIYRTLLRLLKLQNAESERLDWLFQAVARGQEHHAEIVMLLGRRLEQHDRCLGLDPGAAVA
jgi:hypothetical protein